MIVFKYILITMLIFFVWNILKRLFLGVFYRNLSRHQKQEKTTKEQSQASNKSSKINWDAQTVDYEEIDSK
jgi:hypothetical protein